MRTFLTGVLVLLCSLLAVLSVGLSAPSPMDMVFVSSGEFTMGTPEGSLGLADEHPERRIYLSAFYIDRFEVTNDAYLRFVQTAGHRMPEHANPSSTLWAHGVPLPHILTHPVVNVSWEDAQAYCRWAGKRLPTEAEWEKAARGTDGRRYPWGNVWDFTKANSASYWAKRTIEFQSGSDWEAFWVQGEGARVAKEQGVRGEILTLPVGSFPDGVSPYGIHDMAGNASEWVQDWYDPNYYRQAPLTDPAGPPRGAIKAKRGGSWLKPASSLQTTDRDWGLMDSRPSGTGFRCAKDGY